MSEKNWDFGKYFELQAIKVAALFLPSCIMFGKGTKNGSYKVSKLKLNWRTKLQNKIFKNFTLHLKTPYLDYLLIYLGG